MSKLHNLIDQMIEGGEDECLLNQLLMVAEKSTVLVNAHNKLDETFNSLDMGNIWLECADCKSPVLLNSIHCPYCECDLVDGAAEVAETPAKGKKVKPDKKKPIEDQAPAPEPKPEKAEDDTEVEDDDEGSLPSEKEINKMRKPGLAKIIEDHELDVNVDDHPKTKDLRNAVNEAIDKITEDDDDEEVKDPDPDEEEDPGNVDAEPDEEDKEGEEATDKEVDDFDLDDFEDDDDDEDDSVFEED